MICRFCGKPLEDIILSLGSAPLSNSYLREEQLVLKEKTFPLDVFLCTGCFLVQIPEFESPENIFKDYAYFSSFSDTWKQHTKIYADSMVSFLNLKQDSLVIEIASNDGCLLKNFTVRGIPVLGIEPACNVADVAIKNGIPTEKAFFGISLAKKLTRVGQRPDLLLGNNVLAHVPDINDFIAGLKILLKPRGVITLEFPHLMKLIDENQFDTIYHEHFSYFSLLTVQKIFDEHNLDIFDVEELPVHGGSLRIYVKHKKDTTRSISERVSVLKRKELERGLADKKYYSKFRKRVAVLKREIQRFFKETKANGRSIVAYGAPAKGNTLLNCCGLSWRDLSYTVDKNPNKQGRFLPGSHIPIKNPEQIKITKPDFVFILPWNIKDEIMEQMGFIREWGGRFVLPIPKLEII